MTTAELKVHIPRIVKSQPLPIADMIGAPTTAPTHDKIFLQRLFNATPELDRRGINSVNIVVDMAKMSIEPTP
jgi:hypothetical protein